MANLLIGEVYESNLPRTLKAVLGVIASNSNEETREAYPGYEYISHKVSITERHLVRVINQLVEMGILERTECVTGRGIRQGFRINSLDDYQDSWFAKNRERWKKKGDIHALKGDIQNIKGDIHALKGDIHAVAQELHLEERARGNTNVNINSKTSGKTTPAPSNQLDTPFNSPDEVLPEVQPTTENRIQILDRLGITSRMRTEKDILWLNKELNEMEGLGIDFQESDNFLVWWYRNDFRGVKFQQKPTLKQIRENWLSYKSGNEQASLAPIDITNTVLDERGQRVVNYLKEMYSLPSTFEPEYVRQAEIICKATREGMEKKALDKFFAEQTNGIELKFLGSKIAGWVALKNKQAEGKR